MSLKFRNSQGVETPVAGLNGTSGELVPSVALQQSGTVNLPQQQAHSQTDNLTVTFTTPMPDTNYIVVFDTLTGNQGYRILQLQTKTVNGFKFSSFNSDVGVADATSIKWKAFKLMTDTVHEADAAHIAQNTANFAPAFSEVTSYAVGDYVTYNNVLYRCTTAHTAGTWVAGHFTQVTVGGDMASIDSKIPSTASSTEKLAYVEYNPSTSLYSTWAELLELLHQKGAGYWTGSIYIGKWYIYTARITIGGSGYWYGTFLAKGAETEDLIGASKIYGAANTWIVTHYVTEKDILCFRTAQNDSLLWYVQQKFGCVAGTRYRVQMTLSSSFGAWMGIFAFNAVAQAGTFNPDTTVFVKCGGNIDVQGIDAWGTLLHDGEFVCVMTQLMDPM